LNYLPFLFFLEAESENLLFSKEALAKISLCMEDEERHLKLDTN
jgi:hypothetical protein